MDVFSHAAWGATFIRKSPCLWWAVLFGALPDLLAFAYGIYKFKWKYSVELVEFSESKHQANSYFKVYHFFHSIIPISIAAFVILMIAPRYAVITAPYYLHIFMDIFTHQGVWATRIFYPFSNFHFKGGTNWWKNKWISIFNWAALILINLIFFAL